MKFDSFKTLAATSTIWPLTPSARTTRSSSGTSSTYSKLDAESLKDIDWTQVDFKKAGQSSSFDLAKVDWSEVNAGKTAKKIHKAIDWSNESIASEVAEGSNWPVNFTKFDPSIPADINDLPFGHWRCSQQFAEMSRLITPTSC